MAIKTKKNVLRSVKSNVSQLNTTQGSYGFNGVYNVRVPLQIRTSNSSFVFHYSSGVL